MKLQLVFCAVLAFLSDLASSQNRCQTPNRLNGNCINLRLCQPLYRLVAGTHQLTPADRDFLRQSQCGFEGRNPLVCCPLESPPSVTPTPFGGSGLSESDFPAPGQCGSQVNEKIVGGEDTALTDFPWMTLIMYSKPGGRGGYFCGGTLIHKDYVLTAAHCIRGTSLVQGRFTASSVRFGEWDLRNDIDCEDGECADPPLDVPVAETIVHENYVPQSTLQNNDIALIRLARSVRFTDWIKPVCLPFAQHLRNRNFDNLPLVVSGFGKTENASRSEVKKKLEVNGFNLNRCSQVYRLAAITLNTKQLCAGGVEGEDSCNGDSGGPLMARDTSNQLNPYYYLAGVVSFGPRICGTPGFPGVYTKVDQYMEWILSHMRR